LGDAITVSERERSLFLQTEGMPTRSGSYNCWSSYGVVREPANDEASYFMTVV
jgi:hypothetical protein